jgi:hypothetical protein
MSEQEFELYLKLLAKCLHLTSGQREQIADELRDHLEERLEELVRAGVPREKAVIQALDEFGDAAVLAGDFTTIARLKRRRFLMRLSLGSVGALTAGLLIAFAFWPDNRAVRGPERVVAQEKDKGKGKDKDDAAPKAGRSVAQKASLKTPMPQPAAVEHPSNSDFFAHSPIEARIEEALRQQVDFTIDRQVLEDSIKFVSARYQIPILFDRKSLGDANVDLSSEVMLDVPGIPLRDVLSLLLNQLSSPLAYEIRNGVLMISTVDVINEHLQVVVYDCRDLVQVGTLDRYPQPEEKRTGTPTAGVFQVSASGTQSQVAKPNGSAGSSPNNSPAAPDTPNSAAPRRLPLIQTLIAATGPDAWNEDSGATISELGGLLVVRQNRFVHERIKRLLADVRQMRDDGAFASFAKDYEAALKKRASGAPRPAPGAQQGSAATTERAIPQPPLEQGTTN